MAITHTTRSHSAINPVGGLSLLLHAISSWYEGHRTRKALSQLSERQLDDIGLTRADIDRVGF